MQEEVTGVNGGSSAATIWSKRALNVERVNEITGSTFAGGSITLPAGKYKVTAFGIAEGGAHQTRLIDETNGVVLGLGGMIAQSGTSSIYNEFVLTGQATLALQTMAEISVVDTGFGTACVWGEAVFASLAITKIGV